MPSGKLVEAAMQVRAPEELRSTEMLYQLILAGQAREEPLQQRVGKDAMINAQAPGPSTIRLALLRKDNGRSDGSIAGLDESTLDEGLNLPASYATGACGLGAQRRPSAQA